MQTPVVYMSVMAAEVSAIIDAASGEQIGAIKLDGHPESFQLEKSGPRIFVNIPTSQKIAVVDREKRAAITAWPIAGRYGQFPNGT